MKEKQSRGSLVICEGFACPTPKSKSLDFRPTQKQIAASSVPDTGAGKPLADCFGLLLGAKICSVATASFRVSSLPKIGTAIIGSLDESASLRTSNFPEPPTSHKNVRQEPALKSSSSSAGDKMKEVGK